MSETFRLLVLYRTYDGENSKPRPPFYTKELAAHSLIRAAEALRKEGGEVDVVVVQDGPAESPAVPILRAAGAEVILVEGGRGGKYSWAWTVRAAAARRQGYSAVYLVEDDYLHTEDALVVLREAFTARPRVDFISLYDHPDEYSATGDLTAAVAVTGTAVYRASISTCLTFALRTSVLDRPEQVDTMVACIGGKGSYDHWMWLRLLGGPVCRAFFRFAVTGVDNRVLKKLVTVPRAEVRLRQRLFGARLVMPLPGVATHLEAKFMARGRDWAAEAEAIRAWARM
jgi:hypothetical protein